MPDRRILRPLASGRSAIVLAIGLLGATAVATAIAAAPRIDDTRLVVGDQRYAAKPTAGSVFACRRQQGPGGAGIDGPWFNGDGTWDRTKKVHVRGRVHWPAARNVEKLAGAWRMIRTNALPSGSVTGTFPVGAADPAYAYDRNPNAISAHTIAIRVPAKPRLAARASCIGAEVGIATNGVPIFNAFDAGGRDAGAHEVQDRCDGHPQEQGVYHYHDISACLDMPGANPSSLVGYAFDGFGIYGSRDASGRVLTDADLDACHGTTSLVRWQGRRVRMYHYVATHGFPYTVGCFRGTPAVRGPLVTP